MRIRLPCCLQTVDSGYLSEVGWAEEMTVLFLYNVMFGLLKNCNKRVLLLHKLKREMKSIDLIHLIKIQNKKEIECD